MASGATAAIRAGSVALATVPTMSPRAESQRIIRTSAVSLVRPTSGRAASKLVGATPGWAILLVIPQPAVLLSRLSSRPNSPHAILDCR
ncbi:Uncharacterised protein [Mycobacteroides abscessus subsp. abscessus]|nr:Uncharacterised protein [Mycobacteroides abscessus subsp. abscessus]